MKKYSSGQTRLMDALLQLIEEHQLSPSVEVIAERAGYSRRSKGIVRHHFGSREKLVAAAVQRELYRLDATVPIPTDNLRDDLMELVRNYHRFYVRHPFLALMMLEIASNEELKQELQRLQAETVRRLTDLYEHHQSASRWCAWIQASDREELIDRFVPFLGGIFARVVWNQIGIARLEFDPARYVDAFLSGYGCNDEREQRVGKRLIEILHRETGTKPSA